MVIIISFYEVTKKENFKKYQYKCFDYNLDKRLNNKQMLATPKVFCVNLYGRITK